MQTVCLRFEWLRAASEAPFLLIPQRAPSAVLVQIVDSPKWGIMGTLMIASL